ncbi:MAG: hypothetical protein JO265_00645 [Acidimicrobiia bacterium]|nr:hypothetical protein [Acidimicrobiia bacterium]
MTSSQPDSLERDRSALELRVKGKSFSSIARTLEFPRALDANEAFNRALRRCPDAERSAIVAKELERLDALSRADGADGAESGNGAAAEEVAEKKAQRARAIKGLRERLLRE